MPAETERLGTLRDRLLAGLTARVANVHLNGDADRRIAGNLNLSFAGIDNEMLLARLPDIALSSGSACTSAAIEPSYVLRALGLSDDRLTSSLRIGLGRFTTDADVDYAIERIAGEVERLRQCDDDFSPPMSAADLKSRPSAGH
jgi:cysteine desulfurase